MPPSLPIFLLTGRECKNLFHVALPSTIRSLSWNSLRTSSCCCIQNLSIEGTRYVPWIRWNVEELKNGSFKHFAKVEIFWKLLPEIKIDEANIKSPACMRIFSRGWEHHLWFICSFVQTCKENIRYMYMHL